MRRRSEVRLLISSSSVVMRSSAFASASDLRASISECATCIEKSEKSENAK